MKPKNKIEPWLFAAPALVIYVFIVILPILWSLTYSFTDWNGIGKMNFIGLDNYVKLFSDKTLWIAFKNNIFFMVLGTVFQLLMGLVKKQVAHKQGRRKFQRASKASRKQGVDELRRQKQARVHLPQGKAYFQQMPGNDHAVHTVDLFQQAKSDSVDTDQALQTALFIP